MINAVAFFTLLDLGMNQNHIKQNTDKETDILDLGVTRNFDNHKYNILIIMYSFTYDMILRCLGKWIPSYSRSYFCREFLAYKMKQKWK